MNLLPLIAADLVAIGLLVLGLYRSRHGRKDLVISFIGANVGVMAVAAALTGTTSTASLGVGLGLFGVLSIIRLRSTEIEQHDVAYFFSSLAIGLIAGLGLGPWWLAALLITLPVAALWVVDHPRFMSGSRRQRVVLDEALTDEVALRDRLEQVLGATVNRCTVLDTDLIQDRTIVEVTFRRPAVSAPAQPANPPRRRLHVAATEQTPPAADQSTYTVASTLAGAR